LLKAEEFEFLVEEIDEVHDCGECMLDEEISFVDVRWYEIRE